MSISERKIVGQKPFKPITEALLRSQFQTFGNDNWMVTLVPVDGGHRFHVHPTYEFSESRAIQSENSKNIRVFKTLEAALNLAKKYGFKKVTIELSQSQVITKKYARSAKQTSCASSGA